VAEDGFKALLCMKEKVPDLIITDIIMDGMDGLALIREVRNQYPNLPVIAISGGQPTRSVNFKPRAAKDGADEFMEKPVRLDDLFNSIQLLLNRSNFAE